MPLQSKEVVTLRLILDCDCGEDLDAIPPAQTNNQKPPTGLLDLPVELRLHILRYLLLFSYIREGHTRRLAAGSIEHLFRLDSRRILEAPQFRHKSRQEIDGALPLWHSCPVEIAPLLVCKVLHYEARWVLYQENEVVAVQSGLRGLRGRLKNYGIPVFGPFSAAHLRYPGKKPMHLPLVPYKNRSIALGRSSILCETLTSFNPTVVFQGSSSVEKAPFYVCSSEDAEELVHALWLMVKSPFAHDMRFNIITTGGPSFPETMVADALIMTKALPWLCDYIDSITIHMSEHTDEVRSRLGDLRRCKDIESKGGQDGNVHNYDSICSSLNINFLMAENFAAEQAYHLAETHYERTCYQACSVVRTRTSQLVEVSSKRKDGINRICKLIALSAFRLCELRSGAITAFPQLKHEAHSESKDKGAMMRQSSIGSSNDSQQRDMHAEIPLKRTASTAATPATLQSRPRTQDSRDWSRMSHNTTRLDGLEAIDNAIVNGLLAIRLPCATPIVEWNIRLNEMLLSLFTRRHDHDKALYTVKRLCQNYRVVLKEARAKGRKTTVEHLEALVQCLQRCVETNKDNGFEVQAKTYQDVLVHSHEVVRRIFGERLVVNRWYTGLIWTFRYG